MMSLYKILLFFHVLSVIVWFGGAIILEVLGWYVVMTEKKDGIFEFASFGEWMSKRVFMPSGVATIIFGVLLVIFGKPAFNQLWIILAIIGVFIASFTGSRVGQQVQNILKFKKSESKALKAFNKLTLISRIDLAILFFLLFDMIIKPTPSSTAFFIISSVFFVLTIGGSYFQYKQG